MAPSMPANIWWQPEAAVLALPEADEGDVLPVVGTWVGDLRGERLWWSDNCHALFGVDAGRAPVSLRTFLQRVHPQDRRRVSETLSRALLKHGVFAFEYRVVMPDGEIPHLNSQFFTLTGEDGQPVGFGATVRRCAPAEMPSTESDRPGCVQVLIDHSCDGIAIVDHRGRLGRCNAGLADRLGLPPEFVHVGASLEMLLLPLAVRGDFGPGDPLDIARALPERMAGEGGMVAATPSGTLAWRSRQLDDGGWLIMVTDQPGPVTAHDRLLLADSLIANNPAGIVVADRQQIVRSVNPAYCAMTGFAAADCIGQPVVMLAGEDSGSALLAAMGQLSHRDAWSGELRVRRKTGEDLWVSLTAVGVKHAGKPEVSHYLWLFTDISERKRVAEQVHHLAHHDPLTGLPNRLALNLRLNQALPEARRHGWNVALMFIDLDHFKIINDTLGHSVGDQLLREIAGRLTRAVRESDFVARLGGDEFVVLLPDIASATDAATVASKILAAFARPVVVDGTELHTSPSIGISVFPLDGADSDTILKNADTAMYCVKAAGRNSYQFFAVDMNLAASRRLDLEGKLRQALARNEFTLAFQPQVRADTGLPNGVEALVRWRHPVDGLISPALFIPVAEETGLIVPLGEWVLRTACHELKRWLDAGLPSIKVAVNVSACQLRRRDFLETVAAVLVETELPAELLELEVTESVAMENPEESISLLQSLRRMGVTIAIDDFGTGYSSLAYLKRLPIDNLKIDRSFVADIEHDLNDRAIAFGTIALAHSLGLSVIAEGVETEDQFDLLAGNGCDEIQGYLFSPPLAPDTALAFLQRCFASA